MDFAFRSGRFEFFKSDYLPVEVAVLSVTS